MNSTMLQKLLALFLTLFLITGCGSNEPIEDDEEPPILPPTEENEKVKLNISLAGDILEVNTSPMVRSNDGLESSEHYIYALQIYQSEQTKNMYTAYANGVTESTYNLEIEVEKGFKYKIIATAVKNGYDVLYTENTDAGIKFDAPFYSGITNKITLSSSEMSLGEGYSKLKNGQAYSMPNIDRYYGEAKDIIISEDETIQLYLKRMVFGLQVEVSGMLADPIYVGFDGSPGMQVLPATPTQQQIFSLDHPEAAWAFENQNPSVYYSLEKAITIDYRGNRIYNEVHDLTRKTQTTFKLNVTDNSNITIELEEDTLLEGDTIEIDVENK